MGLIMAEIKLGWGQAGVKRACYNFLSLFIERQARRPLSQSGYRGPSGIWFVEAIHFLPVQWILLWHTCSYALSLHNVGRSCHEQIFSAEGILVVVYSCVWKWRHQWVKIVAQGTWTDWGTWTRRDITYRALLVALTTLHYWLYCNDPLR